LRGDEFERNLNEKYGNIDLFQFSSILRIQKSKNICKFSALDGKDIHSSGESSSLTPLFY
jgi:hypothetical protein